MWTTQVAGDKPRIMPNAPAQTFRRQAALPVLATFLPWLALLQPMHQINHDVAWFYYVARGVMDGGTLYKDFTDLNAPLAPLSLVPAVLLARAFTIRPDWAVEIFVLTVASVSMLLSLAVLQRLRLAAPAMLSALLALTIAFVVLPDATFGQREHILAILLTPYVLGCIGACAGARLLWPLSCAIGLAAAIAVGIKPYYVVVPAALETAVLVQAGFNAAWRAQSLALAACLAVIIGATLVFFPLYAAEVVHWAAALYGGYNASTASLIYHVCFVFGTCGMLWFCWGADLTKLASAARLCLTVAALAAFAAFMVQAKGWLYQLFPCLFFLLLLAAGALLRTGIWPGRSPAQGARWFAARLVAAGFALAIVYLPYQSVDLSKYVALEQAILAEPGPFVILSANVGPGFPLALDLNRVWASRENCMIMLPGLVKLERQGKQSPWAPFFRDWISSDMRRYKPALVFLPPVGEMFMPADFDILPWLLRDPQFAAIWTHYRPDGARDGFRVFRLS
jgi:hypothetical protein